jgi:hypothetical protein
MATASALSYSAATVFVPAPQCERTQESVMAADKSWLWALAAATAMTLVLGAGIGGLAEVDAGAAGLPVVRLDRVEVVGNAPSMQSRSEIADGKTTAL